VSGPVLEHRTCWIRSSSIGHSEKVYERTFRGTVLRCGLRGRGLLKVVKGWVNERRCWWGPTWSLVCMLLVLPSLKTMYWVITWGSVIDIASRFESSIVYMRVRRPMHTASCSVALNLYFLSSAVLCYMGWMWP